MAQMGFSTFSDRYPSLDAKKDALSAIDFMVLGKSFGRCSKVPGASPSPSRNPAQGASQPMDAVLKLKTVMRGALYNPSDEHTQGKQGDQGGGLPEDWADKLAKRSRKDTDARWIKKHGKSHYGYTAIWRVDNPSADSRITSRILRIGNLFIELPSCQKGGR